VTIQNEPRDGSALQDRVAQLLAAAGQSGESGSPDGLLAAFEQAITAGGILPGELPVFDKRYGDAGTAEHAQEWIATASRPVRRDGQMTMVSQEASETTSGRPDEELTLRIELLGRERRKEDGVLLDYADASRLVLADAPDLARQYIEMPAELWGRG
jgi:hypothetical protein